MIKKKSLTVLVTSLIVVGGGLLLLSLLSSSDNGSSKALRTQLADTSKKLEHADSLVKSLRSSQAKLQDENYKLKSDLAQTHKELEALKSNYNQLLADYNKLRFSKAKDLSTNTAANSTVGKNSQTKVEGLKLDPLEDYSHLAEELPDYLSLASSQKLYATEVNARLRNKIFKLDDGKALVELCNYGIALQEIGLRSYRYSVAVADRLLPKVFADSPLEAELKNNLVLRFTYQSGNRDLLSVKSYFPANGDYPLTILVEDFSYQENRKGDYNYYDFEGVRVFDEHFSKLPPLKDALLKVKGFSREGDACVIQLY